MPDVLEHESSLRAVCWFKPQASTSLAHIWAIKATLEDFGYPIDVVTTKDPGVILYEDGWQAVARPRRR